MSSEKSNTILNTDSMHSESSLSEKTPRESSTSQEILPKSIKRRYRSITDDEDYKERLSRSRASSFSSDFEFDEETIRYHNEVTKLAEAYEEAICKAKAFGEEKEFVDMDKTIDMIFHSNLQEYAINNVQFWIVWAGLEALKGDVNVVISIYAQGCEHFKHKPLDFITLATKMRTYVNRIKQLNTLNDILNDFDFSDTIHKLDNTITTVHKKETNEEESRSIFLDMNTTTNTTTNTTINTTTNTTINTTTNTTMNTTMNTTIKDSSTENTNSIHINDNQNTNFIQNQLKNLDTKDFDNNQSSSLSTKLKIKENQIKTQTQTNKETSTSLCDIFHSIQNECKKMISQCKPITKN